MKTKQDGAMKERMDIIRGWNIDLGVDDVLRGQGADPAIIRQRRPALVEIAGWALEQGLPLLEPAVLFQSVPVEGVRHSDLLLAGGNRLRSPLLVQHLAHADKVVAMVCTIGPQVEEITHELMQSDPLQALALEGFGTAAVEALTTLACRTLEEQALEEGQHTSIPLSPGMENWPVEPGQRQLFELLDAAAIGVRLNPNLMMSPRMSLSQLVGVGREMGTHGSPCDYCNLKETCRYKGQHEAAAS